MQQMNTRENFIPVSSRSIKSDFSELKDPSLLEIEKVVRKVIKYNQTAFDKRKIRPNALFTVGVNELSTEDILGYFSGLGPSKLEWIDDHCCNIVWDQQDDCIKAYLKISKEQEVIIKPEPEDEEEMGEGNEPQLKTKLMADGTEKIVEKKRPAKSKESASEESKEEKDKKLMPPPMLPGEDMVASLAEVPSKKAEKDEKSASGTILKLPTSKNKNVFENVLLDLKGHIFGPKNRAKI